MAFAIDDLANVIAHWSADQIGGLSDGDPVTTFPDSIASWDLTGSSTTRPLYRPTGINSLPAMELDGTDDYMESASKSVTATNLCMCSVVKPTLKDYNPIIYLATATGVPGFSATTSRSGVFTYGSGSVRSHHSDGSSNLFRFGTPLLSTDTKVMLTTYHAIGRSGFAVNAVDGRVTSSSGVGVGAGLSSTTLYAELGRFNLGSSFFDGMISEIVVWDESTLCESAYIEGVLAHKFGITLPTTHPFYSAAPTTAPGAGGGGSVRIPNIRGGADQ